MVTRDTLKQKPLALFSLSQKEGSAAFARGLCAKGFEILSTGGTAQYLRSEGISVIDVSEFTGAPEILGGRVKTLHPKIHGGILADPSLEEHKEHCEAEGIRPISLVCVNFYDFAHGSKGSVEDAIESIDIGGPCMLRAAAKNHKCCWPVVDPADYERVLQIVSKIMDAEHMELQQRCSGHELRRELAAKAFAQTASYEAAIAGYWQRLSYKATSNSLSSAEKDPWPNLWPQSQRLSLRYGENPHQSAALYADQPSFGLASAEILGGKELSYNNWLDLQAGLRIVDSMKEGCLTIIKHNNPCGFALWTHGLGIDASLVTSPCAQMFQKALAFDTNSAFGGLVITNRPVDLDAAKAMNAVFLECVLAPEFSDEALALLRGKKNLRILRLASARWPNSMEPWEARRLDGAWLVQKTDTGPMDFSHWQQKSSRSASRSEQRDLQIALSLVRHLRSNAVAFVRGGELVGMGFGQTSRIASIELAAQQAKAKGLSLAGSVMASEAFFPFRDSVDKAAELEVSAIVQPGGSLRDEESVRAADQKGLALYFSGRRHFLH